jgi:hypothetical protein
VNDTTVIITGSRTWTQRLFIYGAMDVLLERSPGGLVVRNGKCPDGADRMVHDWTVLRRREGERVREIPHPANWTLPGSSGTRRWWTRAPTGASPSSDPA